MRSRPVRRSPESPRERLHQSRQASAAPRRRWLVSVLGWVGLVLALWVGSASTARADGLADEAELHFQIGAEHYQRSEFREALEHFLLSARLVPNKNVVFNIARTFEKLGRYADAHRYYIDTLEGETDKNKLAEIEAATKRIAPFVSVLAVKTDPPGATIYIDRKDLGSRGRSPRPLAIAPGKYKVIVELQGYEPATSDVIDATLGKEVVVDLKLRKILGTVKVAVQGVDSVDVRVDDEQAPVACTAPCDVEVPPGTHILYFSRAGYQGAPRQIVVGPLETVSTTAKMAPLQGSLIVQADERGAVVEVDGKPMGFTPAVIQGVPVGPRKVRISLRGYKPVEFDVKIQPNEQTELLDIRLVPVREVTAVSRYAQDVDDAPSSLTIIDGQELRAFGYPTIAEALRGVRGVSLTNDRAYVAAGVRGIGQPNDYGNRLLVLSDGLSLNDNLLNSSYIGSDGRSDLHDIERIEVIRGPGSLLYGTGAFSGVVNLVTRYPDNPDSVHVGVGAYGQGVGRVRTGFQYKLTDDIGMWASAWGARSDGFDHPVQRVDITPPAEQIAQRTERFRAAGTAGRITAGPVSVQGIYHQRKQSIPTGLFGFAFNDVRTTYLDRSAHGEARFEPRINESIELLVRGHAHHYNFVGEFQIPAPDEGKQLEELTGSWFGGEVRATFRPLTDKEALRLSVGVEGQHHPKAALFGADVEIAGVPVDDGTYLDTDQPYSLGAAYGVVDAEPIEWLRLSGGARVDAYSFGAIVVPRGAVIFEPVEGSVLKAMGGRAFRAPSLYEQFYAGFSQVPAVDPARGLDLGPESIYSGELEYSQRFLEDWVALGAFHVSYITGIIETILDPDAGVDVVRYSNSDVPVLTVGGEVELRREWRQGWMLSAFYGYQSARYVDPPDPAVSTNQRVINAPEHLAGAKGVAPIVQDLASIGVRSSLEAPRRISPAANDQTNTAVMIDIALSGQADQYGISYVAGVYNLFDWRHRLPGPDSSASPTVLQDGRTFMVDLMYTYR